MIAGNICTHKFYPLFYKFQTLFMKKSYTQVLFLFILSFEKGFSQRCTSFGCAKSVASITTDGTLADTSATELGGCFAPLSYKQIYWQFFYAPVGGVFKQSYTPANVVDSLDLDYLIYDMGTSATTAVSCPVDITGWTEIRCNPNGNYNLSTGPGSGGNSGDTVFTTVPLHYYAIVVIVWQGSDTPVGSGGPHASLGFSIGAPTLDIGAGDAPLTSSNCSTVLPVKLSSFGAKVNKCIVNLNWEAENEISFKKYEVETSKDGKSFQAIATINPMNNGSDQTYSYQHNNPQQGKLYYRLKMTDADGKFEYSKIIAMKLDCNRSSVFVYPNPVTDILNVNITNASNNAVIANLFDHNGKLMYSGKMISGTNLVNMTKFAKGIYLLKLKSDTEIQNIKIMK